MYQIIRIISFLVRQFLLPNPFINIIDANYAFIVNLLFGGIFVRLAYRITGSWYISRKGEWWIGSLGFLINYTILTFLTIVISKVIQDVLWIAIVILVITVLLCYIENKLFAEKTMF